MLMANPADQNILTTVNSYQNSLVAGLSNANPHIFNANKRFKNPGDWPGQLGDTITFDIYPQMIATTGLALAAGQLTPVQQLVQTLTVDQAFKVAYPFSAEQFIFNDMENYMKKFGMQAMVELGSLVGKYVSSVALNYTYRCYDATVGGINSFTQLASILAAFRNYGDMPGFKAKCVLQDTIIPQIIGSGLSQFVMKRNEEIANSWQLGEFANCEFFSTNILSEQIAGTAQGNTLTVVSISPSGNEIVFSGAGAGNTLNKNDILTFDKTHAKGLYFVTPSGHITSTQLVQVRVKDNVTADGSGNITVPIFPALISDQTNVSYNINIPVANLPGTLATIQASHRAAYLSVGDPIFLAMPMLPTQTPYITASTRDPDTGVAVRSTYGWVLGANSLQYIHDVLVGVSAIDRNMMRIALPI